MALENQRYSKHSCVTSEYRNRGIGKRLEEKICAITHDMGHQNIYCFTSDRNIIPWYEKHGWQVMDTEQLHGHGVTVMQKRLI
jgi:N-acetylglutamate synthase-like GNAT family acetyltransferase